MRRRYSRRSMTRSPPMRSTVPMSWCRPRCIATRPCRCCSRQAGAAGKAARANGADCAALLDAAATAGAPIGVNQNFVHHPAFARLRGLVAARALGKPNFIGCVYNVPLRQLAARQFGHWMFTAPVNLLLEQAVHPLSQISGPRRHDRRRCGAGGTGDRDRARRRVPRQPRCIARRAPICRRSFALRSGSPFRSGR